MRLYRRTLGSFIAVILLEGLLSGLIIAVVLGGMQDEEAWEAYLKETVTGVKDWNEYLANLKKKNGADFFDRIKIQKPSYSDPIITGV